MVDFIVLAVVIALVVRAIRNDKADGRPMGGGSPAGRPSNPDDRINLR